MNYQPKVIRCRLKTGGKTIQEIREKNKGQGMVYRDFENIKKTYDILDGVVLLLSLWDYDKHASYHLHNWDPADDERMMTAFYYAEQYHPFRDMRPYRNDFEKFKADWTAGTYDPGSAFTFDPADVEEIETLCEEILPPPDPDPAPSKPKQRKRKRRRK